MLININHEISTIKYKCLQTTLFAADDKMISRRMLQNVRIDWIHDERMI